MSALHEQGLHALGLLPTTDPHVGWTSSFLKVTCVCVWDGESLKGEVVMMDKDYTANLEREGLVREATEAAHHAQGHGTLRVHGKGPGVRIDAQRDREGGTRGRSSWTGQQSKGRGGQGQLQSKEDTRRPRRENDGTKRKAEDDEDDEVEN